MVEINLLPWREQKREQEKKKYTVYLLGFLIASILAVMLVNYYVTSMLERQDALNHTLELEIDAYKHQIKDIKNLQKIRQSLIARMQVVQNLQATRILTVRLFDELINVLPDGVYITKMERQGDKIILTGFTESNSNISQLMRSIQLSQWIQLPQLTEIKKTKESQEDSPSEFKLNFLLKPKS